MTNPNVSEVDVAQSSRPCKGCGEPIYRTVPVAPIPHYHGPDCRPRCIVEGCEKPPHATRAARFGDPLAPRVRYPNEGACSVGGCDEPMRKRTWCAKHYAMWTQYGEIREWKYQWGSGGYNSWHRVLTRLRGRPSEYSCVDCNGEAREWSYDGDDPDEQLDPKHGAFARNPDAYSPRCVRCHRIFDENPIAVRQP